MFLIRCGHTYFNCDQIVKIEPHKKYQGYYEVTFSNGEKADFMDSHVQHLLEERNENGYDGELL